MRSRLLVTGGAGFIGSAFIRFSLARKAHCCALVNLDLLTYSGNKKNLEPVEMDPRYSFVHGDINDVELVERICTEQEIDTIVHFAAESHVDRSIAAPLDFFETNVRGTLSLLEVIRRLPHVHFHHISTDEVFGSLDDSGVFTEDSPYRPNSPYSASKAASDHFVRAYVHTFGISATVSHCSNNYGPCQHPEKFIPRMIVNCFEQLPLPVYGQGLNIRDWLYVDDHAEAVWRILEQGRPGEVYAIGGGCGMKNIDLLHLLIEACAQKTGVDPEKYRSLVQFVTDRPGHDYRYAIDSTKIKSSLGWYPRHDFAAGIKQTVDWYFETSILGKN